MDDGKKVQLEILLDAWSLSDMLAALGDICEEKAGHIRANWSHLLPSVEDATGKTSTPDDPDAVAWEKAGSVIHTTSQRPNVKRISYEG